MQHLVGVVSRADQTGVGQICQAWGCRVDWLRSGKRFFSARVGALIASLIRKTGISSIIIRIAAGVE